MPLHPRDLQDFISMLGEQLIPEGFEEEYAKWLSMWHRRGKQGPLGDLMIPLCRQFGLEPPAPRPQRSNINWRTVPRDQRILVTLNGVAKRGYFKGMGQYGELEVSIEGQSWIQSVKQFQVEIDNSLDLPPELNLTPAERKAMQPIAPEQPSIEPEHNDLPDLDDSTLEDDEQPPVMRDPRFMGLAEGQQLVASKDGEQVVVEFVCVGPGDSQVIATLDGEEDIFDESLVYLDLPVPSANGKPKRTAKKKPAKK